MESCRKRLKQFQYFKSIVFNTRIAQANLITNTDFYAKLSSLNREITKIKAEWIVFLSRNAFNHWLQKKVKG